MIATPTTVPAADATRPPGASLRALRALLNAVLFAAACILGCAVIGRLAPFPEVSGIYPKWKWFREHGNDVDVLFVGSSRLYHAIIPPQFDAAVAAAGLPLHSFNASYDAMWPPESLYFLRQLLALRHQRLKWVVIEMMNTNTQLDDRNVSTQRMAYWHDLQHTLVAFRHIRASQSSWNKQFDQLVQHGRLCLSRITNMGHGADLLGERFEINARRLRPPDWLGAHGYSPEPEEGMEGDVRTGFLKTVERIKRGLPKVPAPADFYAALSDLVVDVRKAGAEPIFVVAPTINSNENYESAPGDATIIALNDPSEYPQLFNPDHHFDAWHLNGKGAVDFTQILATRFAEHVGSKR